MAASAALFSVTLLAGLHLTPANSPAGFNFPSGNFDDIKNRFTPPGSPAPAPSGGAVGGGSAGGSSKIGPISGGRCYAVGFGYNEVKNAEAIAKSAANVSAYICSGDKNPQVVESIAEATATAYAVSVAEASVFCEGTGNVVYYANASAKAEQNATVWLEAYATAIASASTCSSKCSTLAESFGYIKEQVFLKAVAESKATVDGYSKAAQEGFGKFFSSARTYNTDVQVATASAFSKAIAGAKEYHDESQCFAWVNSNGCVYNPSSPDLERCSNCTALSIGATRISEIDALAEASTAAGAFTCGTNTTAVAEAYVAASAVAEVVAEALSFAYADCAVDDVPDAYGCSVSLVAAEDTARAVAEAFATSWAGGYTCDDTCTVETDAAISSISKIIVKAVTDAFAAVCAVQGEQWTISVLAKSIEEATVDAVAESIATAVVGGGECFAASLVDISIY